MNFIPFNGFFRFYDFFLLKSEWYYKNETRNELSFRNNITPVTFIRKILLPGVLVL